MRQKAEVFDKLQYLFHITGFNDHQLHCVIYFDNKLEVEVMEKAVKLLIEIIPMLGKVYKDFGDDSYWEEMDQQSKDVPFVILHSAEELEKFTTSKTDEKKGPQIKVGLYRGTSDILSIIINHMVCDGAGFKECVYLLSCIYSNLIENPQYKPEFLLDGNRNFDRITHSIGKREMLKILLSKKSDNNQNNGDEFPLQCSALQTPFIIAREISEENYKKIREQCTVMDVKVNDVILTAYFRVISHFLNVHDNLPNNAKRKLEIPIMIDMRRYLQDKRFLTLTNLSSTTIVRSEIALSESFQMTLQQIHKEISEKKAGKLGMNSFLKLKLLFALDPMLKLSYHNSYDILKKSLNNPKICMTNIGIVDSEKLRFKNVKVNNAIVCGSIKYHPHFQMSVSTFENKMTLCVNLYGNKEDKKIIRNFLQEVDFELNDFITQGKIQ